VRADAQDRRDDDAVAALSRRMDDLSAKLDALLRDRRDDDRRDRRDHRDRYDDNDALDRRDDLRDRRDRRRDDEFRGGKDPIGARDDENIEERNLTAVRAEGEGLVNDRFSGRSDDAEEDRERGEPEPMASDDDRHRHRREDARRDRARADSQAIRDREADALATAFQRWDRVCCMHGHRATRPLDGEQLPTFVRRHARRYQKYSPGWKNVDLSILPREALLVAEKQIRADAEVAARDPSSDVNQGALREVHELDPFSGRKMIKFYGPVSETLAPFTLPRMRVKRFNRNRYRAD
jgi:hypothetical protein